MSDDIIRQRERAEHTAHGVTIVDHYTKTVDSNGVTNLYKDSMLKSDEAAYIKDQQEKGYMP